MHSVKRVILFALCSLLFANAYAQNEDCTVKISLITCGPGEELYSVFGHSAFRVQDRSAHTDIIYNYGTFDFGDPEFYVKFVRGKLMYYVSVEGFRDFLYTYQLENRYVIEQELLISCAEKYKLYEALRINALEENKHYLYEFLFDNCSTRLRDILKDNTADTVTFRKIIGDPAPTFRNMIHEYLNRGEQYWSKFGIDLLLASRIDRPVKNEEAMFLPDFLMKGFDSAYIGNQKVAGKKQTIFAGIKNVEKKEGWQITPMIVGMTLLIAGSALVFARREKWKKIADWFDLVYFLILGLMGCFMLFMWFGTAHELCRDNYNVLWAIPTHAVMAFFIPGSRPFVKKYFAITAVLSALIIITSPFFPQGMNSAFFPLIALAGIRSAYQALKK